MYSRRVLTKVYLSFSASGLQQALGTLVPSTISNVQSSWQIQPIRWLETKLFSFSFVSLAKILSESFKDNDKYNFRVRQRIMSHILLLLEEPLYSRRSSCQPCLSHDLQLWHITLETHPTNPSSTTEVTACSSVLNGTSTKSSDPSCVLLLCWLTAALNRSRKKKKGQLMYRLLSFWNYNTKPYLYFTCRSFSICL